MSYPAIGQPLMPMSIEEAEQFIASNSYCMQEKHDGVRMALKFTSGELVKCFNRKGKRIYTPRQLKGLEMFVEFSNALIDGEFVDGGFIAFDLLEYEGKDLRDLPYGERLKSLVMLFSFDHSREIRSTTTVFTSEQKRIFFDSLQFDRCEGVVFKRMDQPWQSDRSDGHIKVKFWKTLSAVVHHHDGSRKHSVCLQLLHRNRCWIDVGSLTIPQGTELPKAGDIVEVRYLYASLEKRLIQPVFLDVRDDVEDTECTTDQLIFKK